MTKKSVNKELSLQASVIRRTIAFIIDVILLAIVGLILGLFTGNILYSLGYNGWWIGFIISLFYFSYAQSINKGQTVGAKLANISVVSNKEKALEIKQALLRNFLLLLVIYNSSILAVFPESTNIVIQSVAMVVAYGYIATFLIFILFHPQHRGIHDLLSNAWVVDGKKLDESSATQKKTFFGANPSYSKAKKIAIGIGSVIVIGGIVFAVINPLQTPFFKELLTVYQEINKNAGVQNSHVTIMTNLSSNAQRNNSRVLQVTVYLDRDIFTDETKLFELQSKIERQVKKLYLEKNNVDSLQMQFVSGYSIGIATFTEKINMESIPTKSIN